MGWFLKKADPITERAKQLNDQIAALEAEIQKLASRRQEKAVPSPPVASPSPPRLHPQPRLRSTALPHGQGTTVPSPPPEEIQEPIFEDVGQEQIQAAPATHPPEPEQELGVRKHDLNSTWRRLKSQFRGPVTSNPKLVHYLSAGSIQGLRPLRYEKRVARNRVIVLAAFLVLALWGLIAIFVSRR